MVVERSSFEVIPFSANRATSATGLDESSEFTPIARTASSPSIPQWSITGYEPKPVAGSASSVSHPTGEPDFDPSVAKFFLQQWAKVKTEDGSIERTYAQCAQTWPLADNVTL